MIILHQPQVHLQLKHTSCELEMLNGSGAIQSSCLSWKIFSYNTYASSLAYNQVNEGKRDWSAPLFTSIRMNICSFRLSPKSSYFLYRSGILWNIHLEKTRKDFEMVLGKRMSNFAAFEGRA